MPNSNSGRLLLVGDDRIRRELGLILRERGFDVTGVASVPEALDKTRTHNFDVVLADLNIHGPHDGYIVVRAMRNINPHCVAIILTGYPNLVNASEGVRLGIDEYFVKPADVASLVARMEEKLAERRISP